MARINCSIILYAPGALLFSGIQEAEYAVGLGQMSKQRTVDWLSWKKACAYTSAWQDSAAFDKAQMDCEDPKSSAVCRCSASRNR
jgi:hypothetical protein